MLRDAGYCADGLSSARHDDPTLDENYDILFEAFCLFVTSESVNVSAIIAISGVHEYACGQ